MIIALYGEKRVGKDTAAELLHQELPHFRKVTFARIPKEILSQTCGISLQQFENLKNEDPTFRQYLINFAESMKKYFGKDIWVKLALKDGIDNIIITDLRFEEEYEYIKNFNPIIIHIKDDNIKETDIDKLPYDFEIDNTEKNIPKLKAQIKKILWTLDTRE
jgi:dephospho-CoA kinase